MQYKALFPALLFVSSAHASNWHAEVAPYLWASGLKGTVQIADKQVKVDERFVDLIKELKFGAMLWAQAYNDEVGVFFNGLYTKVADAQTKDRISIDSTSQMTIAATGMSRRIYLQQAKTHYLEPYVGLRYTNNTTKLSIDRFNVGQTEAWTDGIIGSRFNYIVTPAFNLEAALDFGRGNHSSSYNWSVLAGYQSPNHFKNTRFYLGYRFLHQNYSHGQGIRYFKWDMDIAGPVAGFAYHFG